VVTYFSDEEYERLRHHASAHDAQSAAFLKALADQKLAELDAAEKAGKEGSYSAKMFIVGLLAGLALAAASSGAA
jgi:hypothetical protein